MHVASSYPVLLTDRVAETAAFYQDYFEFRVVFDAGWYVSLQQHSGARVWELAVLRYDHETIPSSFRQPSQGILLNFEVDDAGAEYDRLVKDGGLETVLHLQDEAFGQRHFMVVDPAGNLIDVIENIEPDQEYRQSYL